MNENGSYERSFLKVIRNDDDWICRILSDSIWNSPFFFGLCNNGVGKKR
jgi:hypothetical protein